MEPNSKTPIFIQPSPGGGWLWARSGEAALSGTLQELANWWRSSAAPGPAVLLLPAEDVLMTRAQLPTRSAARIAQALPFALEEHLLDEAESLLCVPGPTQPDGHVVCGVISRERMRQWLAALEQAGIPIRHACPDALLIPWNEGEIQALDADGRTLLRWGAFSASAAEAPLADVLLESLGKQPTLENARVRRHEAGSGAELLSRLARHALPLPMDFMQDEFLPAQQRGGWHAWRLPAALAASVVLLMVAGESLQTWRMANESERLAETLRAEFSTTFPAIKRIQTDPAPQIALELQKLRQAGGQQHGTLLELLSRCAPLLASSPSLSLSRLQYRDGRLELGLESKTIADLDGLRMRLESAGMSANQGSAQLEDNRVKGTISVALRGSGGAL